MKKMIVSNLVTLDGFIAGPNGELDWFRADEEFLGHARNLLRSVGTLLFGRRTYEMMAKYWPTAEAIKSDPIVAERMNSLPKVVVSKSPLKLEWNNSRPVRDRVAENIEELKKNGAGDIVIFGSGELVSSLLLLGLIDELRLFVHPIILGRGQPEYVHMTNKVELDFLTSVPFKSGVIMLAYKPRL